jgi:O-antigen ligase
MTGRTDLWAAGLQAAAHSPVFGYGPQSDRFILDEHIHNAYMYALLQGGVIGLIAFSGGLIITWCTIFRLSRNQRLRHDERFTPFVQTSALIIFFSIRGVTEVSGAMFAVDLMIMVPAIAYLGILDQTIDSEAAARIGQSVLP